MKVVKLEYDWGIKDESGGIHAAQSARIRELEAQLAEANRRTNEMISRTSKSLKRDEQTGAAIVAMLEASSALAESIEAAVPGLRDNHETPVMAAFVRMMEAQQAAVAAMDGSVEAFQVVRDEGLREMLRLIELANADRDAARADIQRERDKIKSECDGCARTEKIESENERLRGELVGQECDTQFWKGRAEKFQEDLAALRARDADPGRVERAAEEIWASCAPIRGNPMPWASVVAEYPTIADIFREKSRAVLAAADGEVR